MVLTIVATFVTISVSMVCLVVPAIMDTTLMLMVYPVKVSILHAL